MVDADDDYRAVLWTEYELGRPDHKIAKRASYRDGVLLGVEEWTIEQPGNYYKYDIVWMNHD